MQEKTLFRNKDVLSPHFVPEALLHRDAEVRTVMRCIAPAFQDQKAKNLFIYGRPGTGKTACVKGVLAKMDERGDARVRSAYMNCRVYDSRYKVLQKCVGEFKPGFARTGYSFAVLYEEFLDWIEGDSPETAKRLVVALDEIDMIRDLDPLVYTLTRINDDLVRGSVSLVGISNSVNFKNRLDSRSRSSICEEELVFASYNANQLRDILSARIKEGFQEGAVTAGAVNLAAAVAASENGDARYALSLLLRAGELAQKRGKTEVTDALVEESRRLADEDTAFDVIGVLPQHQQYLLYALACLAQDGHYKRLVTSDDGERLYFSGEVYERYCRVVKQSGKQPRTARWYREYLGELESAGLVSTVTSGKGVRGHTTLIRLGYDADKVRKVIEKTLLA
ncbi:MAG: AAA family ATPase [Candidatus Micrarchaeia archaeon]